MTLALPPAAWERDAPAVEICVRWGSTLLVARHLEPPRSFSIGDHLADFAIDVSALETRRIDLVVARRGELFVVAPRGMSGTLVLPSGRASTLAETIADGTAAPHGSAPGAHAIRLAPGVRVHLALPARARGPGYRTAGADEEPSADRLVFEIAAVPAGGRVDRGHLRGHARLVASCLVVAALAAGALHAGVPAPLDAEGVEAAESERRYDLYNVLQAIDEKAQLDPIDQLVENPVWRATGDEGTWQPAPHSGQNVDLDASSTTALLRLDRYQLTACLRYTLSNLDLELPPFPPPLAAVCTAPVLGPMGLPGLGDPLPIDPEEAVRQPSAFWFDQLADPATMGYRAPRSADDLAFLKIDVNAPPPGPLQIIVERIRGEASMPVALREIRRRRAAIQRCIDLDPPYARGRRQEITLEVDRDGVASPPPFTRHPRYWDRGPAPSTRDGFGGELPGRCLVGALAGIHLGEPSATASELRVTLRSPHR
jgi:hypothetical protein